MFQLQGRVLELQLQHRHSDGSWAEMEAADHDPASSDPEREWANGDCLEARFPRAAGP